MDHLISVVKTKNTELLFLSLFIKLLKPGGRAAIVVPDGILFKSNKANKALRKILIEEQKLDAVISMPSGVFKPYSGVSTSILIFTKTNSGGTNKVWFYDMSADGFSLDDHRSPLLENSKLGVNPLQKLTNEDHSKNNLPDILSRWHKREENESLRSNKEQSFNVDKKEIQDADYDLILSSYKTLELKNEKHTPPQEIISELKILENKIISELNNLEKIK